MSEAYRIMGRYCDGPAEEVDTAETEDEADYLLGEYTMAFGLGWSLWKETQTYQDGSSHELASRCAATLVDCG